MKTRKQLLAEADAVLKGLKKEEVAGHDDEYVATVIAEIIADYSLITSRIANEMKKSFGKNIRPWTRAFPQDGVIEWGFQDMDTKEQHTVKIIVQFGEHNK